MPPTGEPPPAPEGGATPDERGGPPAPARWMALAAAAVAFAAHARALGNQFLTLWDDNLYVTGPPEIRAITLANVAKVFQTFYVGNYAPVQMLSYMLDHAIWGMRPFGFILTDVALHALNAALVFQVLRRLGHAERSSLAGALLFALHPVQVETVAWISQRKTLLAMAFSLGAILWHLRWRRSRGRTRVASRVLAHVSLLLALLSKSVAVVVPPLLLLHDLLIARERDWRRALRDSAPYLATAGAAAALALLSQRPETGGGLAPWHGGTPYHTFLTMLTVFRAYLAKLVWPAGLSPLYSPPIKTALDWDVASSAALLLAVLAAPLLAGPRRPTAAFWTATFLLGLAPVSQVVPLVTLMNDRYLYFPMLGVAGGAALLLDAVPRPWRAAAFAAVTAVLAALGAASAVRTGAWATSSTLWADAVEKGQDDPKAWYGLGLARDNAGEPEAALVAYRRALALDPSHPDALYNTALLHVVRGDFAEALAMLRRLLAAHPGSRDGVLLAAHVRYFLGDYPGAAAAYQAALSSRPGDPEVLNYLALALSRAGDRARAEALLSEALARGGHPARLLMARAGLESMGRREAEALEFLRAAVAAGADRGEVSRNADLAWVRTRPGFREVVGSRGTPPQP